VDSAKLRAAIAVLSVVGVTLGVVAGVVQLSLGSTIPAWTGNKADTTGLGVTTIVLSLIAGAALWQLRRPLHTWTWVACGVVGIAAPAVCFTTVGRLWFVPGPVLLVTVLLALLSKPVAIRVPSRHASTGVVTAPSVSRSGRGRAAWIVCGAGVIAGVVVAVASLVTVLPGRGPSSVGIAAAVFFAMGVVLSLIVAPQLRHWAVGALTEGGGAGFIGGGLALACIAITRAIS
jgi:hypothetical protein